MKKKISKKQYIDKFNERLIELKTDDPSYGIKDDWRIIDVGTGYDMVGTQVDWPYARGVLSKIAHDVNQEYDVDTLINIFIGWK